MDPQSNFSPEPPASDKPENSSPQPEMPDAHLFSKVGLYIGIGAMLFFPRSGGCLTDALVGGLCSGGGSALGLAVGSFSDVLREAPDPGPSPVRLDSRLALLSLLLGLIGLVAWFFPLVGFPITISGVLIGKRARRSSRRRLALIGMGLSLIGLLLTSINSYVGAFTAISRASSS